MESLKNNGKIFAIGAAGYFILETIWRGHSHWSMAAAGGISLLCIVKIFRKMKDAPLYFKSLVGGTIITAIEFVFGIIFNIFLGMAVWDYSSVPGNILGQICPAFSILWCGLSLVVAFFEKNFSYGKIIFMKKALP